MRLRYWSTAVSTRVPTSPYFFGHQLWSETRTELFTQLLMPVEAEIARVRPRYGLASWITSVLSLL